jgi:hypothetical protein
MGLASNYTAAELSSLAPEERAALENAEGDTDGIINEIANGGEGEGATAAPAAGTAPAGESAAAPAAASAAAAPAAQGTEGAAAPAASAAAPAGEQPAAPATTASAAPSPNAVVYTAKVGDVAKDVQTQKDAIKAARTEKRQALMKLNDGDIEADEYGRIEDAADAKIDAANDKILEINRSQSRAEVAAELTQQQQELSWKGMLDTYVATAKKDDALDYAGSEPLRTEFNGLVRAFAIESADRGMVDGADMAASRWALEQAAGVMRIRHPKQAAAPAGDSAAGGAAQAGGPAASAAAPAGTSAQPAAAAAALGGLQTLAKMPAAAAAPVADDVMAKIGTLEGEELEVYLASLPKDVYARVTAGAQ